MEVHQKQIAMFSTKPVVSFAQAELFNGLSADVMSQFVVDWLDVGEIASRIVRYISGASHVVQLLVSEAILTSKDRQYVLSAVLCLRRFVGCSYTVTVLYWMTAV